MALFNDTEQPQRNQYLQANPSAKPDANTGWMGPSNISGNVGAGGFTGGNISQMQSNPPSQVQNGTALGSIAQGGGFQQPQNQVGHDGTFNGMNREQWRDKWMSSGRMSPEQMQQKLTEMGATNAGRGDIWTTPFGETYDLGMGYKTGNPMAAWTPVQGMFGGGQQGQQGGMLGGGYMGGVMQQIMQMLSSGNTGATPINALQNQMQPNSQSSYFSSMNQQPSHNPNLIQSFLGR